MFMCIRVCACEQHGRAPGAFIHCCLPCLFRVSLTDLLDKFKVRPWDPPVSASCLFPSPPTFGMTRTPIMPTFCMDTGNPNSGPHTLRNRHLVY